MSSLETYLCRHLHMQRKRSKPNPVRWVSQERFRDNKGNSIEQQGLFRFLCTLTSVIEPGGGGPRGRGMGFACHSGTWGFLRMCVLPNYFLTIMEVGKAQGS